MKMPMRLLFHIRR